MVEQWCYNGHAVDVGDNTWDVGYNPLTIYGRYYITHCCNFCGCWWYDLQSFVSFFVLQGGSETTKHDKPPSNV